MRSRARYFATQQVVDPAKPAAILLLDRPVVLMKALAVALINAFAVFHRTMYLRPVSAMVLVLARPALAKAACH